MNSQIVQCIACGYAALAHEYFRRVLQRITTCMVEVLDGGMHPSTNIADPIQWRPREFNRRADWLCNKALNTRESFSHIESSQDVLCSTRHLQWEVFTDGGCRGDGFFAYGWIIYDTFQLGEKRFREFVAFGYEFIEGNFASFVVALLGLDRATDVFLDLIRATS